MAAFDISNVLGNPLYLGSIVLAFWTHTTPYRAFRHLRFASLSAAASRATAAAFDIIGWFIMLVGDCISARGVPITWWFVFYELFLNAGVFAVLSTDTLSHYRVLLVGSLTISIGYLTGQVNTYIGVAEAGFQASSAGSIFILMVHFVWIIAFGSSEDSYVVQLINSWSVSSKPGQDPSIPPSQYQGNSYAAQQGIQMGSVNKPLSTARSDLTSTVVVSPNAQYAYKARALYTCEFVTEIGRTVMREFYYRSKRLKRRNGRERVSCAVLTASEN
ncbi:hypothetical protein BC937DRAFT_89525 [Endogone sp. FLAS-F59071]|nr:hypothetical protein BC937DRAFT_89525 [Endogone sp. FLAS-F59071]|eukprot:RUS17757.1 hypothetical protein BC937DRAFT_89525 [Endogone sp. FLAS-F59071]